MSEDGLKSTWRCPACGRENAAPAVLCSLCFAPRPGGAAIAKSPAQAHPRIIPVRDDDYRPIKGLSDFQRLLPGMTIVPILLACLLLGVLAGLGVVLLLVLIPALFHLTRVDEERKAAPAALRRQMAGQGLAAMLTAIGIALVVVVSSLAALVGVPCLTLLGAHIYLRDAPPALLFTALITGLFGGLAAAGCLAYGLVRLLFRREKSGAAPWGFRRDVRS